jgi:Icc-related predicted phosphoesterase
MKITIVSDLHLEFEPFEINTGETDLVILAGDIDIKGRGLEWIRKNFEGLPVIYVLGNHEYYGKSIPKLSETLKKETEASEIHVLEKDVVRIQGINFLGCTLWTDYNLFGDPRGDGFQCQQKMTDFRKIRVFPNYSKLRSIDVFRLHQISKEWLTRELEKQAGEINIVVTHHGPSPLSLPPGDSDNVAHAAYVSDLHTLIKQHAPACWIHGHVHSSSDYRIGSCRVICNPKGYPDELNRQFNPNFTIEIDA